MQCLRLTVKILLNWKYLIHLQHQIIIKHQNEKFGVWSLVPILLNSVEMDKVSWF